MSIPQGIEPPAPEPPYAPGDLFYDRVAVNGASYPVLECNPISPLLAGATRATWQVIFELPTGDRHYMWVNDDGYTPALAFGPRPFTLDDVGEQLRAARIDRLDI